RHQLNEYLSGKRKGFSLPLKPEGTTFQKSVWHELLKIPYGTTTTYATIATAIGNAKACRAVGRAVGANPIFIIIPCHRVIGSSGKLTGFAYGLDVKRFLLGCEGSYGSSM
ncbi:MAG TPA: cysteine methyltransferase, partial [Firmicutes bacterium]|nr:cysteine methyltransferase [Bacillota bacterium]